MSFLGDSVTHLYLLLTWKRLGLNFPSLFYLVASRVWQMVENDSSWKCYAVDFYRPSKLKNHVQKVIPLRWNWPRDVLRRSVNVARVRLLLQAMVNFIEFVPYLDRLTHFMVLNWYNSVLYMKIIFWYLI